MYQKMLDKQITKKIEFKNLLSKINEDHFELLNNLELDLRSLIIEQNTSLYEIKNSRKYLSLHKPKEGRYQNNVIGVFKISLVLLLISLISWVLKNYIGGYSSEFINNLSQLAKHFFWIGIITFGVTLTILFPYMQFHLSAKEELNLDPFYNKHEKYILMYKTNYDLAERKVSILEVFYEMFKTRSEKNNEYIRSVIIQEIIKQKYEELNKLENKYQNINDLLSENILGFSGFTIKVKELIELNSVSESINKQFFNKVLVNIDKRLNDLN